MTASSFRYLFKEGFRNTWTNRMMSIASICVLMSCLVLMGCATMIFLNIDSLLGRIEDENVVMVFVQDDTTDQELKAMEKALKKTDNIKAVDFVPKEDAYAEQLSTMDEAARKFFTEISSDIPLPDAFKVTVDDLTKFDSTLNNIKEMEHIETIRENKDLARKLVTIRNVSLGLVWGFYEFAITQFKDLIDSLGLEALSFMDYALPMLGAFVAIGILTGVGGSIITMSRYLNKEGSEISGV